jgi:hypothetical protein
LKKAKVEIVPREFAEIVIWSVFPNKQIPSFAKNSRQLNWLYTGENIRPHFSPFDVVFSYDYSNRKNAFRLPLWWLYLNLDARPDDAHKADNLINPYNLHKPRKIEWINNSTISAFIGNMTDLRVQTINSLPPRLKFIGFGTAFENLIDSKIGQVGKFSYNLCFENDYFPGYHTEKLLQAWVLETVPLYFGSKTVGLDFNSNSFINLANFRSLEGFWDYILGLNISDCVKIVNSPLLNSPIDFSEFESFLNNNLVNI